MDFSNLWKHCYRFTHASFRKVQIYVAYRYQHVTVLLHYLPRCLRSTAGLPDLLFAKRPNLVQKWAKKEPNAKKRGQKKGQPFFPNLSTVTESYEPILSNLLNGQCSSITTVAQQQNKHVMKDCKITTWFPCVAINWDKFVSLNKC